MFAILTLRQDILLHKGNICVIKLISLAVAGLLPVRTMRGPGSVERTIKERQIRSKE